MPRQEIVTARCIIPYCEQGKLRVLLMRRSMNCKHNRGLFELPGGTMNNGEGLVDAAIREAKEETGLQVELLIDPVLAVERIIREGDDVGVLYRSFGAIACGMTGELATSPAEHSVLGVADYEIAKQSLWVSEDSRAILGALAG
jgi:ADP-ribose pyrophosphatase YjhB (NUDIX family)